MGYLTYFLLLIGFVVCGLSPSANSEVLTAEQTVGAWEASSLERWLEPLSSIGYKKIRIDNDSIYVSPKYVKIKLSGRRPLRFRYRVVLSKREGELIVKLSFDCRVRGKKYSPCEDTSERIRKIAQRILKKVVKKIRLKRDELVQAIEEEDRSAWEWSSKGRLVLEARQFRDDGLDNTEDFGAGLSTRIEATASGETFFGKLAVFSRIDTRDRDRSISYFEDTYLSWEWDDHRLLVGSQILNWSATEAFHPADIINSRNWDGSLENAEKIGEPMINYIWTFEMGSLALYYQPMVVFPFFPTGGNRLSMLPLLASTGRGLFLDHNGEVVGDEFSEQYSGRLELQFDSVDFAIFYVHHIDRSQPNIGIDSQLVFHPIFIPVDVSGFSFQWAIGSWVIKSEVSYRDFIDPVVDSVYGLIAQRDHSQIAVGVDYGLTHKGGSESTIIVEGQFYGGVSTDERVQLGLFQNDLFLGYRWALNDEMGKEVMMSVLSDLERENEYLIQLSYSSRLSDTWRFKLGAQWIDAPLKDTVASGLEVLHNDHQVFLDLSRYF